MNETRTIWLFFKKNNMNNQIEKLLNRPRFGNQYSSENLCRGLDILISKYLDSHTIMAEIGSFRGISSELFAINVKHIYCIDPYIPYSEMGQEIKDAEYQFDEMLKNSI